VGINCRIRTNKRYTNLDDYDLTDLTIRVIDQMKKQSGMEPTPRSVRERYAPWTLPKPANAEKKNGEEKNEAAKKGG
jgi:hypothetical protein